MSKKQNMATLIVLCYLVAVTNSAFSASKTEDTSSQVQEDKNRTLVLFNYEEYIGSKTIKQFKKATGISVEEVFFDDEEEALGALQSNPEAYDIVVISSDSIREMIAAKTLAPLNHDLIPNINNIRAEYYRNHFDDGLIHSIPFMWGTTGYVINTDYIDATIPSWNVLWDESYRGKIGMLNSSFEVVAAALLSLGYSINTTNPDEHEQARKALLEQKPLVHGYYSDLLLQDLMISEEIYAAQIYNGEGLLLMDEDEKFEFHIPVEGAAQWIDSFVIPRRAVNYEEAHAFLNFILDPEINAAIASEVWYATPVDAAIPLMDEEVREAPEVYPPDEVLARCEYFNILGDANTNIARIWADLQFAD